MGCLRWAASMALVAVLSVGCNNDPECGEFPLDENQRRCVVETIDEMVAEHYPFVEYKGIDMDEFSRELWETLDRQDRSDQEFLGDVNYVLRLLEDGHTRMEKRFLEQPATVAVDVRTGEEEQLYIAAVYEEQWSHLVGRRLETIDGRPAKEAMNALGHWTEAGARGGMNLSGLELALAGEAGTSVTLGLDGGQEVELSRRSSFGEPRIRHYGEIGYLRLDTFGFIDDLERIDEAINELMDTSSLIIDIRNNGGGFPSVSDGLFGRLIDEKVAPFQLVDVRGEVARDLEARPRGRAYQGEVVVLVNGRSYSASNFFAHRMVYHERGILIGERTGGGAASPKKGVYLLPGIWFQVSSHLVLPPNGVHSESGLSPTIKVGPEDESAPPIEGAGALRVDDDPVLNRALRYLMACCT